MVRRIGRELSVQGAESAVLDKWNCTVSEEFPMEDLGERISGLCGQYGGKAILMVDEVDKSSDNQIFLSFLGLLRAKYLARESGKDDTFQSVILAGVYDIKNLKLKLHEGVESKYNSPWNIAADFRVDMSFQADDIERMLSEYEEDYHTGMDIRQASRWIFEYTAGYPYMVSRICKLLDERVAGTEAFPHKKDAWTGEGFQEAIRLLLKEPNMLFDDMVKKLQDTPDLKTMLSDILFRGGAVYL
nr:AAA family ATPase [uncultured Acetatifactor sp.]